MPTVKTLSPTSINGFPPTPVGGWPTNIPASTTTRRQQMAAAPENAVQEPKQNKEQLVKPSIEAAKEKARAAMASAGASVGSAPVKSGARNPSTDNARKSVERASSAATDGATASRKRSRSGSRKISSKEPPMDEPSPNPAAEKALLETYVRRQQMFDANILQFEHNKVTFAESSKHNQQLAEFQPAYPFSTHRYPDNSIPMRQPYSTYILPYQRRRPGSRLSKELHIGKKDRAVQAEQIDELVPIRLDIEYDKIRIRDTFTWNIHDRVIPPELFAEKLVEDLGLSLQQHQVLVEQIYNSMREQIVDFHPHVFIDEEPLDPHLPYSAYKNDDMRVNIKLNITIGPHTLIDQFEWEINNPINQPEEFARQMAVDLGLSGEFTTAIAHAIREQCQLFTRSLYVVGHPFDGRPIEDHELLSSFCQSPMSSAFRPYQAAKEFTPYLYELDEAALEKSENSLSREERRQKRSVNRRGGPALPDLKDRRQVNRTLLVSSVLPGTAESLEDSKIFKRAAVTKKRAARDFEDSDDFDSDDSGPDSPQVVPPISGGTARTRGMRGAAVHATAAMRSAMNRSSTPESGLMALHDHETRKSARKVIRDEASSPEPSVTGPPSLILKLRLPRQKFQALLRNLRHRSKEAASAAAAAAHYQHTPGRPGSSGSPSSAHQPNSTMPPPTSTPRMADGSLPAQQANGAPHRPGDPNALPTSKHGATSNLGRVDATGPPGPDHSTPPPPAALVQALQILQQKYPHDSFEATMRYTAVSRVTDEPFTLQAGVKPPKDTKYCYYPRIRCIDCPGKLYTPDATLGVNNFEVHLRNKHHQERVARRMERDGVDIRGMGTGVAAGPSGSAEPGELDDDDDDKEEGEL